jgi:DNA-binding CsgD family transcriptional regulator
MNFFKHFQLILMVIQLASPFMVMAGHQNEEEDSAKFYFNKSIEYYRQDSFYLCFKTAERCFQLADSAKHKEILGRLWAVKGYLYLYQGADIKAIQAFSNSKQIGQEVQNIGIQIEALHGIGRVYTDIHNANLAYYYLNEGLKLAKEQNKKQYEAVIVNALGILEQTNDSLRLSIAYFKRYQILSEELKDTRSIIYAFVNLGEVYTKLAIYDSAYFYLSKAEQLNLMQNDAQAKAAIYGNFGKLKWKESKFRESILLINQSMVVSKANDFSDFIIENYNILILNYQAIGDSTAALEQYKMLDNYKDSIHRSDLIKRSEGLQSQFLLEEKAAKAKFWQQKYRNRNLVLSLTILLAILTFVVLFLLYKRYRQNYANYKVEKSLLNQTIDEKNRELVTRIITDNHRDSALGQLSKSIEFITKEKDVEQIRNFLLEVKRDLTKKEQIGNNWDGFKLHFENVHPHFFENLKKIKPDLTQSELRLCAYIKMNLTTKEIANLLNISDRSIQTNRYRLKRKLGLDANKSLINYIQAL